MSLNGEVGVDSGVVETCSKDASRKGTSDGNKAIFPVTAPTPVVPSVLPNPNPNPVPVPVLVLVVVANV